MKRILLIILLASVCLAPTIIDQLNADFTGTTSNINITSNQLQLSGGVGSYAASGTYTSDVKDLGSNPRPTISWTSTSPSNTSVLVSTRSGPTAAVGGQWTGYSSNYATSNGTLVANAMNRYYQYRVQLASTNVNVTSSVQAVTLFYTQYGPNITNYTSQTDLNSDTTGSYTFRFVVNDTVALTNVSARYALGNDSNSSWITASNDTTSFFISVPSPNGTWSVRGNENLVVTVYAQNANGDNNTVALSEYNQQVNHPPTLNTIANTTATEGTIKTIFTSGIDIDGDTLTWYSEKGTATSVSATAGRIDWTPDRTETGLVTFAITLSDGENNVSQNVTVNVTDVNDAPVMQAVESQSGHYGDTITFLITVGDNDTNQNITYRVYPDLFDVVNYTPNTTENFTYYGIGTFLALDDFKGNQTFTFYASDGTDEDSQNATLSITYCGDLVCQSVENATSCSQDCATDDIVSYLAVQLPDRFCTNQTASMTTFNASSRFICFYEGRTYNDAAFCREEEGVDIHIYNMDDFQNTDLGSSSSSSNGTFEWTPPAKGQYKLTLSKTSFVGSSTIVTVNDCIGNITLVERVVNFTKPQIEAGERRQEIPPQLEEPARTIEQTSILSVIIWYIIIPLLLAGLLYTGSAYYDLYQDTDPRILAARIKWYEIKSRYAPLIKPYADKVWIVIEPVVTPLVFVFNTYMKPPTMRLLNAIRKLIGR